ncbi:hypothetical protein D3C72_1142390 [compost metagenome]
MQDNFLPRFQLYANQQEYRDIPFLPTLQKAKVFVDDQKLKPPEHRKIVHITALNRANPGVRVRWKGVYSYYLLKTENGGNQYENEAYQNAPIVLQLFGASHNAWPMDQYMNCRFLNFSDCKRSALHSLSNRLRQTK